MPDDDLKRLLDAIQQENAAAHTETRRHFDDTADRLAAEMRRDFAETADRLATGMRRDFGETADRLAAENRHYFEISTEATKHEVSLIAEKVMQLDERLTREAADIRDEMRRGFSDTQAMIKFSHAELDRRVRSLEETTRILVETLTELQSRVERLEGSTH